MNWSDIRFNLELAKNDNTADLMLRSASRIIPQIGNKLEFYSYAKNYRSEGILAIFRGIIAAKVCLAGYDSTTGRAAQNASTYITQVAGNTGVARATRSSLSVVRPIAFRRKIEDIRIGLQAARDVMENTYHRNRGRPEKNRHASYIDIWAEANSDILQLNDGGIVDSRKYPLPLEYQNSDAWDNFVQYLLDNDDSWSIWYPWLRHHLMGVEDEEVPSFLWPEVERRIALLPNETWYRGVAGINSTIGSIILSVIDDLLEKESGKGQADLGITYKIDEEGRIDLRDFTPLPERGDVRASLVMEVISSMSELSYECKGNSSAKIKEKSEQYLQIISKSGWSDPVILIMRGDALRKELSFQLSRDEESDIPPIPQSVLKSLEQSVSVHNMLVNTHAELRRLDLMLLSPDEKVDIVSADNLRALVENASAREVITVRAQEALKEVVSGAPAMPNSEDRRSLRVSVSAKNLVHYVVSFIWKYKKAIGSTVVGVPPAIYLVGKWALSNEAVITGYFTHNPGAKLLVQKVLEWLHTLPLA